MLLHYRSSHQRRFMQKSVLRNFVKITGKRLCQGLFFNKVAGLRPAQLRKKRHLHSCFPLNFAKFLRTPFFTEHVWTTVSYISFSYILEKFESILTGLQISFSNSHFLSTGAISARRNSFGNSPLSTQ